MWPTAECKTPQSALWEVFPSGFSDSAKNTENLETEISVFMYFWNSGFSPRRWELGHHAFPEAPFLRTSQFWSRKFSIATSQNKRKVWNCFHGNNVFCSEACSHSFSTVVVAHCIASWSSPSVWLNCSLQLLVLRPRCVFFPKVWLFCLNLPALLESR